MERRIELHRILRDVMDNNGVYFQPPDSLQLSYPCLIYQLSDIDSIHADNNPYNTHRRYTMTLIDENPDSEFVGRLSLLPTSSFDRFYTADNLNHYVFSIYY